MDQVPPETLIRGRPDPNAPQSPSLVKKWFILLPLRLALGSILLPLALLGATADHVSGRVPPHQSYFITLVAATIRCCLSLWIRTGIPGAEIDSKIWKTPVDHLTAARKMGSKEERERSKKVEVLLVKVPPVEDKFVKGIAKVPGVKAVERPSWMVWYEDPKCKSGRGVEVAKPGEKIILYLYKG